VVTNAASGTYAAQAADAQAGTKQPTDSNLGKTAEEGFGKVMIWIMSLFAWLVGVAALTLDYAVYYTVVTMGDYVHNLTAVGVAWRIMRDVGNIMLIFGFLAAGIAIILNADLYGWGQKMLPRLLIAAVFLNFSLFISEAVIDTGNLFATQFYTQINGGQMPTQTSLSEITVGIPGGGASNLGNEGISNAIMGQLGLQTIYNAGRVNTDVFKVGNTWVIGFMAIILFIITAFVMFSLAFVLIARFVALVFLIILSPVGFAGSAVPALAGRSKKWWEALFKQTITAPILLLLLYVALAVITDANFLTGLCISTDPTNPTCTPNAVGWVSDNFQGFASFILSFLVAMGLLLYVVYKAKDLGAIGASWATKTAGKLTFGATAWAGRTSGGWLAKKGANMARKTWVGRVPLAGTGLVKGLDKIAGASFDVRGIGMGGGLKGVDIDAGAAQKGGYKADLKGRIESRTKYASELRGRELTNDEKVEQKLAQNDIKDAEKRIADAQIRRRRAVSTGASTQHIDEEIVAEKQILTGYQKEVNKLESVTDVGAKLKYAKALNLWTNKDNFFNKYINLAGNTDAAKKIREEAKKSSDDKTLDALKKALKKAGGEEESEKKEEKKEEEKKPEGSKPQSA
jgi:hypothetical protein